MGLDAAHKGYMYQDILSAYFVAHEIRLGNLDSTFIFDKKKTYNYIWYFIAIINVLSVYLGFFIA